MVVKVLSLRVLILTKYFVLLLDQRLCVLIVDFVCRATLFLIAQLEKSHVNPVITFLYSGFEDVCKNVPKWASCTKTVSFLHRHNIYSLLGPSLICMSGPLTLYELL